MNLKVLHIRSGLGEIVGSSPAVEQGIEAQRFLDRERGTVTDKRSQIATLERVKEGRVHRFR